MKKIITLGINLTDDHRKRLSALGNLETLEEPTSVDDFVQKANGADVIYSDGTFLLESLPELKNVFVTYPYIELGAFDSKELEKNSVQVANAKGGNKDSIAERVMYMVLSLFRKFGPYVRATQDIQFARHESLQGKKVLIIGHGDIGSHISTLCKAFNMEVSFFEKGDNLYSTSKDSDLIINALNCNITSKNLLDESFFMQLKKGCYYISFVRQYTYDLDGLVKAIDAGVIAGAAIDCDPEGSGDTKNKFYQTALDNPQILVTPHIAFTTRQAGINGPEIAVQNIESFMKGTPQNIIEK